MTIINPTPLVRVAKPARVEGTDQEAQLDRLSYLAADVSRRFSHVNDENSALRYVFEAADFDAAEHADAAARVVARVLSYIVGAVNDGHLPEACLDGTESKQFRKGYLAALDQVGTELLEATVNHS